MKEKAIELLLEMALLENRKKNEFIPSSEPHKIYQKNVETYRWLIGILQGGLGSLTKYPNQPNEEEWIRIK